MTSVVEAAVAAPSRRVRTRHFLMCPPRYFDVSYAINPWMDPSTPVSPQRALGQWTMLVEEYARCGHRVDLLDPQPGLPDMVFAANGATVVDGAVLEARFANPQRTAEAGWHAAWYRRHGDRLGLAAPQPAHAVNEAEGDFAVHHVPGRPGAGEGASGHTRVLAGWGFRTERAAHEELARATGAEVVALELVDPRFYHLDVALTVLDDETGLIAYHPPAFAPRSRDLLARLYPDAVLVGETDALAFGLNSVSDGRNVFVPAGAEGFLTELAARGFTPVPVDLSELVKAGGSVKCCTQEIRGPRAAERSRG
ncbi:N-dimethylarginine dimethylaminohydrolase [Friedmanniella endophytica]|uniref:N-dimethylarginine dimethylaminohydrolase n=1 Tax=Microlunatus kandeliicorticis TaxID=1759536 RepID=A0A7W3IPZ0_9ACTN|nr:dimethylargininase [Microlunatus kandeliicorticis]MBA8793088.1 N-dimethylarginine dimethylaminohydrolase [Microlunatus kandeliicorticis]